jgi:tRNA threonylcarbamoyladenosine biosynthesis protein TsaE
MMQLGFYIAQILTGHELIYLQGALGTGKTVFTKGMGNALNIPEEILSPTFVLLREYRGTKMLMHYDLYRLSTIDELAGIDFFDQLGQSGIKVVEWAERFPEIARYADMIFKFESISESKRMVEVYG